MRQRETVRTAVVEIALLLLAAFIATWALFGAWPWEAVSRGHTLLPATVLYVLGAILGTFLATAMSSTAPPRPTYGRAMLIAAMAFLSVAALIVLFRPYFSRQHLVWSSVLWVVFLLANRWIIRRRPWTDHIVVVSEADDLVEELSHTPHIDIMAVHEPDQRTPVPAPPRQASLVVDLSRPLSVTMTRYVSATSVAGRTVRPFDQVYEEHTGRVPLSHLSEGWEIESSLARKLPWLPFKHVLDIVAVLLTLPFWLPLMLIGALLVLLVDGRPVFFRQRRVGHRGEAVDMIKLRTMQPGAEIHGEAQARNNDPRITPLGRYLRAFRVDELPQMLNVLRGELAIVGPRPEQLGFVETYSRRIPFYDQRHLVRPGITGWAQVNSGYAASEEETIEKLSYDFYYLKHMSPMLDLEILVRSVWTVVSGKGTAARPKEERTPPRMA